MSSLYILATGTLIADPQRREGTKGLFATGAIRVEAGEPTIISVIAFGGKAEDLLAFGKGNALSISGRTRPTSWTGRDGTERQGLSITADQIAAAMPLPKAHSSRQPGLTRQPRESSPPLPADRVDDLFVEEALR